MRHLLAVCVVAGLIAAGAASVQAVAVNGATADLDMRTTLTFSNGLQMTFWPNHGWNGAEGYVYTRVGGVVQQDYHTSGNWPQSGVSASAFTANGAANGSTTVNNVNNPGFDYSMHADAMVQGLGLGDYGLALGDAYAWPDWLQCIQAGTATFAIDYTYTLDTTDTVGCAEAYVYMNAFFADHARTNYLTAQGDWTLGYGSNPNTTIVEYYRQIGAGQYLTVTDRVSWNVVIPNTGEPYSWWSTWSYGEAGVELAPVPEPLTMLGLALGLGSVGAYIRRRIAR